MGREGGSGREGKGKEMKILATTLQSSQDSEAAK